MRRPSTSSVTAHRGGALAEGRVERIVVNLRGGHAMSAVSALTGAIMPLQQSSPPWDTTT